MKVKVVEDKCIGCGYCESTCSEVFEVEDYSHVKVDKVPEDLVEAVTNAIEGCPTEAIEKVEE